MAVRDLFAAVARPAAPPPPAAQSFGLRECADRKRGRQPFTHRGLRRGEGG